MKPIKELSPKTKRMYTKLKNKHSSGKWFYLDIYRNIRDGHWK